MSARDLVVRPGDRVSLAGRYLRVDDQDWIELARVVAITTRPGWKSNKAIRAIGLDPKDSGPAQNLVPGLIRVTGIWQVDTITVDSQHTVDRSPAYSGMRLACPPPPGGWDPSDRSTDVPELDRLRESGAIVRDGWLQERDTEALVLRVAAADVELVQAVLGPRLPRRLCVVASRFTAHDVQRLEAGFDAHRSDWGLEVTSTADFTADGQPYAEAQLLRITQDLADWADTFPAGLLRLDPTITPA